MIYTRVMWHSESSWHVVDTSLTDGCTQTMPRWLYALTWVGANNQSSCIWSWIIDGLAWQHEKTHGLSTSPHRHTNNCWMCLAFICWAKIEISIEIICYLGRWMLTELVHHSSDHLLVGLSYIFLSWINQSHAFLAFLAHFICHTCRVGLSFFFCEHANSTSCHHLFFISIFLLCQRLS